jgi:hypothetical protein
VVDSCWCRPTGSRSLLGFCVGCRRGLRLTSDALWRDRGRSPRDVRVARPRARDGPSDARRDVDARAPGRWCERFRRPAGRRASSRTTSRREGTSASIWGEPVRSRASWGRLWRADVTGRGTEGSVLPEEKQTPVSIARASNAISVYPRTCDSHVLRRLRVADDPEAHALIAEFRHQRPEFTELCGRHEVALRTNQHPHRGRRSSRATVSDRDAGLSSRRDSSGADQVRNSTE